MRKRLRSGYTIVEQIIALGVTGIGMAASRSLVETGNRGMSGGVWSYQRWPDSERRTGRGGHVHLLSHAASLRIGLAHQHYLLRGVVR